MKKDIIATSKKHWWDLMKEEWEKRENEVHQDDQMTLLDYVSEFINYQKYGWYLKQASDGYGDGGSGFVVEKERY